MKITTLVCALGALFLTACSSVGGLKLSSTENVEAKVTRQLFATDQVRKLKDFYIHLANYVLVIAVLTIVNALTTPNRWWVQWVIMSWGVGVFFHWLQISERFSLFGSKWEKEQVEKRLGRKL